LVRWLRYLIVVKKVAISSVVMLIVAGCLYKYASDVAEWRKVQDALVRLQSGIKYESVLALRSKLADADAAIEEFRSGWRVFPLGHKERVSDAKTGLSYLSMALDPDAIGGTTLTLYPDVAKFVPRFCISDKATFNGSDAALGFATLGRH
jgi:hypothetical protein